MCGSTHRDAIEMAELRELLLGIMLVVEDDGALDGDIVLHGLDVAAHHSIRVVRDRIAKESTPVLVPTRLDQTLQAISEVLIEAE